jgi:hypothetical protein
LEIPQQATALWWRTNPNGADTHAVSALENHKPQLHQLLSDNPAGLTCGGLKKLKKLSTGSSLV